MYNLSNWTIQMIGLIVHKNISFHRISYNLTSLHYKTSVEMIISKKKRKKITILNKVVNFSVTNIKFSFFKIYYLKNETTVTTNDIWTIMWSHDNIHIHHCSFIILRITRYWNYLLRKSYQLNLRIQCLLNTVPFYD